MGRYRYSRWRWRVLVRALDLVGYALLWVWRRVRARPRVNEPRRILIVQLDHLGDAVLTTPILGPLRARFPQARVEVLASPSSRAVFEADPLVDRVIVAERNWFERTPASFSALRAVWRLGRSLRSGGYELGIDVRGDILSVLVLAAAGIPRRVGWAMGGGGFLLTDQAAWIPGRHEVASRLALVRVLGADAAEPCRVQVHVRDEDRSMIACWLNNEWPAVESPPVVRPRRMAARVLGGQVRERARGRARGLWGSFAQAVDAIDAEMLHAGRFGSESPLLAVHLGAGTSAKRWPLSHWRVLVERFLRAGWRVVVVGGPDEAAVRLGLPPHPNLRDWTSQLSVVQTTALLERADFFIGADSGPAHLAACASVPSVILFSGTNRVSQWRPWSRFSLVLKHNVPCRPCHRKVCPLADHPCLSGISPERVYRAAQRWCARLDGSWRVSGSA